MPQTGGVGFPSAPVTVVTPVTGLVAAGGTTQAVLAWSAAGDANQYSVYRNSSPGLGASGTAIFKGPRNSYADLGLAPNLLASPVAATTR